MSGHRLKQIAIALVALVFLWGLVEIFRGGFDEPTTDFAIPAIAVEDADSVIFERAADTILLVRRGEAWTVNGFRAGPSAVSEFFDVLGGAPPGQLVAQNTDTHARLEIADSTARAFRVVGGGRPLAHLLVGKRAPGYRDSYFRRPGEAEVYSVQTRLASFVDRNLADWRDRTIARIDRDSMASAEIRRRGSSYTVRRDGDAWVLAGGQTTDSAIVARLLDQFASLDATGFHTAADDTVDFDPPDRRAVLRDAAGDTMLALAFDSTAGGFWAQKTGDSTVFRISNFVVDRITPADSAIRGQ